MTVPFPSIGMPALLYNRVTQQPKAAIITWVGDGCDLTVFGVGDVPAQIVRNVPCGHDGPGGGGDYWMFPAWFLDLKQGAA